MAAPRSSDTPAAPGPPGPALDPERFAVLIEICASSGSPASIGEVVDAFVEDGNQRVAEMVASLEAHDVAALADLAHELKGSSGSVGAGALFAAATGLQRQAAVSARDPNGEPSPVEHLRPLLHLTATEFRRAAVALRRAVPRAP